MFHLINILRPLLPLLVASCLSTASVAGINPFNKDINLKFGSEIEWQLNEADITKSGMAKQRGDQHYYHLSINEQQLRLQLTINDTGTEQKNIRPLDNLEVLDILVNNQRLPIFQWCLDNRINDTSYSALNQSTRVKNKVCVVDIERSEITVKLDNESRNLLTQAKELSIDIKPGKYISYLTYNMKGFDQKLSALNSNNNKQPARPDIQEKPPTRSAPTVAVNTKISLCYVRPSEQFSKKIRAVSYPCKNRPLREQAQRSINEKISQLKLAEKAEQRRLKDIEALRIAKKENQRLQKANKEIELETAQRELKWKKMETSLWVGRCMKHWNNGTSPCYCQPYLGRAPANTKDTCKKQGYNKLTQE